MSESGQTSLSSSLSSISSCSELFQRDLTDFRAKVDRKLLEKMLDGSDGSVESAKEFFTRASSVSGAIISFPQMWKLQIMSRKDPEIRIIGDSSQVLCARKLIMDVMDPYRNKVVLKIDVSFNDHSFIIGKGGKRIKSIMDMTQTQIHFPDENLLNPEVKSNIVTITCESLRKADEARQTIRQSLPLTASFQVVVGEEKSSLIDNRHPMIEYYQRRYNVLIAFKYIETTDGKCVTIEAQVRGSRQHFDQLHEAIKALYVLIASPETIDISSKVITINIEIAPRHQSFVMGLNNSNIKAIYNRTGAVISFPDLDISCRPISSSATTVTIKGVGIESAFMAWLQLLEFLPVVLFFDIKVEQFNPILINALITNPLLSIKMCQKINSEKRTVIVKTQERHTDLLFEARKQILGISEEPNSVSVIPSQQLTNWKQSYDRLTTVPYISPELLDCEPEVLRSVRQ